MEDAEARAIIAERSEIEALQMVRDLKEKKDKLEREKEEADASPREEVEKRLTAEQLLSEAERWEKALALENDDLKNEINRLRQKLEVSRPHDADSQRPHEADADTLKNTLTLNRDASIGGGNNTEITST